MSVDRRDLSIGPLGIGETLDRAVALHRRHFTALFLVTLAVEAPLFLLARSQLGRAGDLLLLASPAADRQRALVDLVAPMVATLLLLLLGQLLLSAAAARIVAPSATGGALPAGPATARRLAAALTASAASLLAFLVVPAAGAAPGALLAWRAAAPATSALGALAALLGGGLALLWAVLAFLLAAPASGVEAAGGFRALRRSFRLMRPAPAAALRERPAIRASVVLLAAFAITAAANAAAGLPRGALLALSGAASRGGRLPLLPEILLSAVELAAVAALRPFGLVALAVLYFDRRARQEGLDLERWARELSPPGGAR
jgi:hypothetical protein